MNLATAREQAAAVTTRHQAAKLHNDINHELEHGNYSFEEAAPGEDALHHLQTRFPGVEDDAAEVTTPPRLSHRAKQNLDPPHGGRRRNPTGTRRSGGGGGSRRSGTGSSSSGRTRSGSSGRPAYDGAGRRIVERAAGTTGQDVSDTVITGLQYLLAAGLAYFVVANPKGVGAFSSVLGTVGGGVRKFVAPVDPFSSATSAAASKPVAPTSTSTAPAASTSSPGTARHPNMFQDPFSGFPRLATGPLGSHVRVPLSPLSTGG